MGAEWLCQIDGLSVNGVCFPLVRILPKSELSLLLRIAMAKSAFLLPGCCMFAKIELDVFERVCGSKPAALSCNRLRHLDPLLPASCTIKARYDFIPRCRSVGELDSATDYLLIHVVGILGPEKFYPWP